MATAQKVRKILDTTVSYDVGKKLHDMRKESNSCAQPKKLAAMGGREAILPCNPLALEAKAQRMVYLTRDAEL